MAAGSVSAIYIAAPEPEAGKSTIALGLLHRLTATVAKVGVFRPITRLGEDRDYILELLLEHTTAGLSYEQCVGVTYQQLHADSDAAIASIVDSLSRDGASLRRGGDRRQRLHRRRPGPPSCRSTRGSRSISARRYC